MLKIQINAHSAHYCLWNRSYTDAARRTVMLLLIMRADRETFIRDAMGYSASGNTEGCGCEASGENIFLQPHLSDGTYFWRRDSPRVVKKKGKYSFFIS